MLPLPSPALIGVVHLKALPGSPAAILSMDEITSLALADAKVLREAGFDAIVVENFGDAPFSSVAMEPASVAGLAIVAARVREACGLPMGINALRNDARAGLGIAAATGASFIRVNIHTGVYATDQGIIEGRADETLRDRKRLGAKVAIFADVNVKHATPISHTDIVRAAKDTAHRGLADALVVTGAATGEAVDVNELRRVREAVPERRLFVGSGATAETVRSLLTIADGVIVGTGLKARRDPANPIDAKLAKEFVVAARGRPA